MLQSAAKCLSFVSLLPSTPSACVRGGRDKIGKSTQGPMEETPNTAPSKPRAIIVEDQTTFRELLAELLETNDGYTVSTGATLSEARELLRTERFDLIVLDLVLPDAHGLDLLSELRALPRPPRVVVLTAHSRPNIVKEAMRRGAHA